MENCLVTKFKSVVNNPNLPYFNSMTFEYDGRSFPTAQHGWGRVYQKVKTNGELRILSGSLYSTNDDSSALTGDIALEAGVGLTCYVKDGVPVKFIIAPRNKIITLGLPSNSYMKISFNEILKCSTLEGIQLTPYITEGRYEDIIQTFAGNSTLPIVIFNYISPYCNVTFNGTRKSSGEFYAIKDSNIITIYQTRTGTNPDYSYSDPAATYNVTTGVWTYM